MKKMLYCMIIAFVIFFAPSIVSATNADYSKENYNLNRNDMVYTLDDTTSFWGNMDVIKCGNVDIPTPIPPIVRTVVNLIKIAAPIVLIVMGMIDMLTAVIANDEKKIKDAQMKFPRRLLPAALIFLIVTIMQLLVGILSDNKNESNSIMNCIDCIISDANSCGIQNTNSSSSGTSKPGSDNNGSVSPVPKPGIDNTENLIK